MWLVEVLLTDGPGRFAVTSCECFSFESTCYVRLEEFDVVFDVVVVGFDALDFVVLEEKVEELVSEEILNDDFDDFFGELV